MAGVGKRHAATSLLRPSFADATKRKQGYAGRCAPGTDCHPSHPQSELYVPSRRVYTSGMRTLESDAEIRADGSMMLLSPMPSWLKPGRAHVVVVVADSGETEAVPQRAKPAATQEMIARRMDAMARIRGMDPYRDIEDPVAWQRETRQDRPLPGRE